jgi:hypothetical protein
MGLFEMLRRREQVETVAVPVSAPRRAPKPDAPGLAGRSNVMAAEPGLPPLPGPASTRSPVARLHRRLNGSGEAPPLRVPPSDIDSDPPVADSSIEFRDTEVRPEALAHFHQLPPYQALLTVGPEAVYQLPPLLHEKLIAIDCGARQARLVRATMPAADRLALDGTAKAVKGALRARGYGVVGELVAEAHVLKEILRNAGAAGKAGARGGPMQLFERWIALAVPTGATDLHIEVRRNTAVVRIRIDGRIEPLPDGQDGRYSRKEVVDAIAAGYNSTRKGNNVSQLLRCL